MTYKLKHKWLDINGSGKVKDLTGQVFGMRTVLSFSHRKGNRYYWLCKCECGKIKPISTQSLKAKDSIACGCQKRFNGVTHGYSRTPTYRAWNSMKERCYGSKRKQYVWYGGRGITVCPEWKDNFEQFLKDMGVTPGKGYSLDRIDVNGNYCKENCRWATDKEQHNNKRSNTVVEFGGEKLTVSQWSEKTGINITTLLYRLKMNIPIEDVFSKKSLKTGKRVKSRK